MTTLNSKLEAFMASNDPRSRKKFFETLYEWMAEEILLRAYAYFKKRPNTELLAEEALQNTFEKLMRKELASFEEIADIKAYVLKVAYSQFACAHQRTKGEVTISSDELTGSKEPASSSHYSGIYFDLKKALNQALNKEQKEVVLWWLEGYSYEDIARKTWKSENSVRGLIFRAKRKLRTYLEAYDRRPRRA
jgi:RNA polymerase sigma factor (sigma-70 family)